MANTGDTGNTATLTLSGFSGLVRLLNLPEETKQDVNVSHLGDTSELYIPGDTTEHGTTEFEWIFNPTAAMPAFAAGASITITLPKMNSGSAAAATLIGTGYLNMRKYPDLANNQANIGRGRIKWDGDTPPAFTVEA